MTYSTSAVVLEEAVERRLLSFCAWQFDANHNHKARLVYLADLRGLETCCLCGEPMGKLGDPRFQASRVADWSGELWSRVALHPGTLAMDVGWRFHAVKHGEYVD